MLSSAPVAPTLAVNDLERARRFYEEQLGCEVEVQVAQTSPLSLWQRDQTGDLRAANDAGR